MDRPSKSVLHKLFLLFLIIVLPVFIYKEFTLLSAKKHGGMPTQEDFYASNPKANLDKSFVIMIPGSGDERAVEKLFVSLFEQNYSKFRAVYIDTPKSSAKVSMWVESHNKGKQVKVISCQDRSAGCKAYFDEVSICEDSDVIVHLEGGDFFAHSEVLERINSVYANQDVMLTYGQYLEYSSYLQGQYKPMPKRNQYKKRVHRAPWVNAPLKTYYASLFKKARKRQTITPEFFLTLDSEKALMIPLAELAKHHVRYIPEVLYIHSKTSKKPSSEKKEKALSSIIYETDLVMIAEGSKEKLEKCLRSINTHLVGVSNVYVLCKHNEDLQKAFPSIHFSCYDKALKSDLLRTLGSKENGYVVLATDSIILERNVELKESILALEKSDAYAFYFNLGKKRSSSKLFEEEAAPCAGGIYSWIIEKGRGSFYYPNDLHLTLYRRSELSSELSELEFETPASLIDAWSKVPQNNRRGLLFDVPCSYSIE